MSRPALPWARAFDGALAGAVEAVFDAVDAGIACDRAGIDYGTLDDESRKLLAECQRHAVAVGR